jgi:hypothetical protein
MGIGALAVAASTAVLAQAAPPAAYTQGSRLDARFRATLSGVPIGRGAWVVDIGRDKYLAAASGATAGLLRIFSSGEGTGASSGAIVNGRFAPTSFASSITSGHKTDEVRMAISDGVVKGLTVTPPVKPDPGRVEISATHRRGVVDPMTGSLFRNIVADDDPLVPASCDRTTSVFDGRMRYDVQYAFKRMDKVKSERGYTGPVLVCSAYFFPIAGHVPDRLAIKYLIKLRDIEFWLAPIAGTQVLVPYRLSVPTPLGLGVVEAVQFEAQPRRQSAAPTGAKAER